jgi:leucyl/phenylalanyl-tRNA--protein transferase
VYRLPWLPAEPDAPFPPVERALREPDGLLAMGGDLHPARLLNAYRHGIFPWFNPGEPVLWWSPDPRTVFRSAGHALPRRFRRELRGSRWTVSANRDFDAVLSRCATVPRVGQQGTWIGPPMRAAYATLHRLGHAHAIEVRDGGRLVGGLYGVCIGRMFFGESMFSAEPGGSKVALGALLRRMAQWGWPLLDAQVHNPHLSLLGAVQVPREAFVAEARRLAGLPGHGARFAEAFGELPASELADPGA